MSLPEFTTCRPPSPAVLNQNGLSVPRRWSIMATSEVNAIQKLRDTYEIYRGVPFKEDDGSIPDPSCILQSLSVVGKPPAKLGGIGLYYADGLYSTQQSPPPPPFPGGPVVWSVKPSLVTKIVDHDIDGNVIQTTSEEPFDPPLTKLTPDEILHAAFYVEGDDVLEVYAPYRQYNGTVNADDYKGATSGCMLCHVFEPQPSTTGWILVEVDFQYRKPKTLFGVEYEGWQDVTPSKGRRVIADPDAVGEKRYRAILGAPDTDGKRRPVVDPVYLTGEGQVLAADADPYLIVTTHYEYKDFSSIPVLGG